LQPISKANGNEVAGAIFHGFQNAVFVCFFLQRNNRYLRVVAILLFDDLPYRIRIAIAIEDQQLDWLVSEQRAEVVGGLDPVALGRMTSIAKRAVYQRNVILRFTQDSDRNAVVPAQIAFLATAR
jgi:hypothetical protein